MGDMTGDVAEEEKVMSDTIEVLLLLLDFPVSF
jgi:hypothetical protein